MLVIKNLEARYGDIHVLKGVSLTVDEGEIVTLIGANGAGKTTLLKTIAGIGSPADGRVRFLGEDVTGMAGNELVARGLVLIPEGRGILKRMTVRENLELGAYLRRDDQVEGNVQQMLDRYPALRERLGQRAGSLSGGEQQMLALARAWMARPRLLMMDEPSLGLAPGLVKEVFRQIEEYRRSGVTVLLIEQNAREALRVADRGYVLETGRIALEGGGSELANDPRVQKAYLGV